jgi:hypothetical protein
LVTFFFSLPLPSSPTCIPFLLHIGYEIIHVLQLLIFASRSNNGLESFHPSPDGWTRSSLKKKGERCWADSRLNLTELGWTLSSLAQHKKKGCWLSVSPTQPGWTYFNQAQAKKEKGKGMLSC